MRRAAPVLLTIAWLGFLHAQPASATTPFTARDQAAHDRQTSWSPDGRWIAYSDGAWNGLHLASPDDLASRRFLRMGGATWSPNGERLLGWGTSLSSPRQIGNPDTGFTTPLVESIVSGPDFSPDAARLVYVRHTSSGALQLVVSAWDGTGQQVIAGDSSNPAWSPTGEEIAFAHDLNCREPGGIEVIRADGTAHRSFASAGEWRVGPRWSPDGSLIAFRGMIPCSPQQSAHVYVIRPDGTGERILGDVLKSSRVAWSPNGRWIAAADGGSLTLLGAMGQAPVRFEGSPFFSWAPDGEHLAFTRGGVIYIGTTNGFERRLAPGFGADWSPDGSRLSYLAPAYATEMPFDHCPTQAFVIGSGGQGMRALSPCWQQGDERSNVLLGTSGDDFAEAFGGKDRVYGGAGDDILWGYGGVDRLYGGAGSDELYGGPGADRIGARDGARDRVFCGAGRDVVFADRVDAVSRDCEVVRRATN